MKNIFNQADTTEILNRIDKLSPNSRPQWGKMDVAQMLAHCSSFHDIAMGETFPPRGWLGILIGTFVKPIFYNDKPLAHNMSTIPTIMIVEEKEFETEKGKLKQKIRTFQNNGPEKCTSHPHPFFGKLTPEQWGKGLYKHLDHHLNQFEV
ncbi:hypothetical protein J1TS1_33050 [Shouchella clausii]|jgi:hypothetical protein|uniref:DUF1569 domain-containing protein n=1 Tax=Shouchella rhizosphaerae TaxID=866786 RepID=A0ABZ2CQ56_9BACI|nr:DUF1569 domain-containing protein [Shouchella clausii]MCM3311594.1 DUF1569 domain-containing protein [Psychrobacillus sp. MER TA 17]MBX0320763.1 DUF1569 domain-containing protein [Shouchella clausii]PAD45980.1 hypothetical protein CHI09_15040 [Shouchella clausii]PAF08134.1 hypothetical protein CHH65_16750 [Shouchella clausii]GIN09160.1 hypothetical protein J1TS1_33050 [Shouchella clausii]